MSTNRKQNSTNVRVSAAEMAADRPLPVHQANGDELRYASANYAMNFTKGLENDANTGLVTNPKAFESFQKAIDKGYIDPFTTSLRASSDKERAWEAPTAGVVYELEGPDPQAVTMPPAPALGSMELAYEMAEVYELALIRDEPLTELVEGTTNASVLDTVMRLNTIDYSVAGDAGRPRKNVNCEVTPQTVFRGSSPHVEVGPYLSQFMLIGNDQPGYPGVSHGKVQCGALQIDQRVPVATEQNYLTDWNTWLQTQNNQDLRDNSVLFDVAQDRRFITFPRDLATYVHDDALYEAYLNAYLILLSIGSVFSDFSAAIAPTVTAVEALNNTAGNATSLLAMAFQEGSPMHPSYGARHATVAGACVTILKAFFDTSCLFVRRDGQDIFDRYQEGDIAVEYTASADGSSLVETTGQTFLSLEGELNKLAANISIGRNMAGVHYFSDYYDSLRMGEQIALWILEEQALCYPTDPFVLSVPTFDGTFEVLYVNFFCLVSLDH